MKCPYCGHELELHAVKDADEYEYTIECHSCGSSWFEEREEYY